MVSEEFEGALAMIRSSPAFGGDLATRRAVMDSFAEVAPPPDDTTITPVDADGVPCEITARPTSRDDRWIVYLHGGAYTSGSLKSHVRFVALLAAATETTVLNVDYRLAPEHPHPAAVDDATTAYKWLLRERGVAPEHVVVAGDSAGGGLSAAALVALRDAGEPLPAGAAMISPWTDLTLTSESVDTRADVDPMCSRETLTPSADDYLDGRDPKTPLASPRYADLHALPPLLIHVGDHEVLLDDSTGLADNARSSGVEVELWVAPEMIHVWHAFASIVPESDEALAKLADWVKLRLA